MIPLRHRGDLSTPRGGAIGLSALRSSQGDAFGRFSEATARFFGTARFLAVQTMLVVAWIIINVFWISLRWDPYPFILLNLMFSTQAAYAAPLILLAQYRQAERERAAVDEDREVAARTQADAEFLSRELSSLRIAMSDVVTGDDLSRAVEDVSEALARLQRQLAQLTSGGGPGPGPDTGTGTDAGARRAESGTRTRDEGPTEGPSSPDSRA